MQLLRISNHISRLLIQKHISLGLSHITRKPLLCRIFCERAASDGFQMQLARFSTSKTLDIHKAVQNHKKHAHSPKTADKPDQKKIQIHLIGPNGEDYGFMTKQKASKMATEQELKLTQIVDEHGKPSTAFQLMTGAQLREHRKNLQHVKHIQKKKEGKSISITDRITPHDLHTKVKHITDWLEKGFNVKVHIKVITDHKKGLSAILDEMTSSIQNIGEVYHAQKTPKDLTLELHTLIQDEDDSEKDTTHSKKHKPFTLEQLKNLK